MNCPHCHAPNRDDARFCGVCGQATSATEPVSDPSLGEAPQMIGREIAGRYRVLAKLGEGGMGAVYRAEQISLKRTVAVKLLRPDMSSSALLLRRFNAEAELVAKLSHPNTVNIYDFGQDTDGTLFIAMEFIEGRSLRSVIHSSAPLTPRRALSIAHQVSLSLADAHAHAIIHRDLKPDNVMLQERGRVRDVVRVLDFGIAKLRDDTRATQQAMTQQGDMLGTPQYMAPEQIRAEQIDGRTDVYALGCMIYEMLTGRLPFDAPTIMALLSKHLLEQPVAPSVRRPDLGIPPQLDQLVLAAMAKDPAQRPPTMELFGEHLAALVAMFPPDASDPSAQRSAQIDTPPAYSFVPLPTPGAASAPAHALPTPPPRAIPVSAKKRSSKGLLVALAVIVLGGGAAAAVFLRKGHDQVAAKEIDAPPETPDHDPWAEKVMISPHGFKLVVPPGYSAKLDIAGNIMAVNTSGYAIAVGQVDTTDLDTLVRRHFDETQFRETRRWTVTVNGVERPAVSFSGRADNTEFEEVAVAFFGEGYQLAVLVRDPVGHQGMTADELDALRAEIFEKRVVLPEADGSAH